MTKKQAITSAIILLVLAALVYLQVRTWREFDWHTFVAETRGIYWPELLAGIALLFTTYWLRALRWRIFLAPVRETSASRLLAPTLIGFTGMALLGRPGELVRPYLIARREGQTLSSQMGVWTIERIFDLGGYTLIAVIDLLVARDLPDLRPIRIAGFVLLGLIAAFTVLMLFIRAKGDTVCRIVERMLGSRPALASRVTEKIQSFRDGLNTIRDVKSLVATFAISVALWSVISIVFLLVVHSYPSLRTMPYSWLVLLVGFSIVGGVVQLPAVGGGAQIVTILALADVFNVPRELAVSCGILLWLVGFQVVVPVGLALAHREHVSIRRVQFEAAEVPGTAEDVA